MIRKILKAVLSVGLILFCHQAFADGNTYQLAISPGSTLWLDGNSTLHPYESKTQTFNLVTKSVTLTAASPTDVGKLTQVINGNFVLVIPVTSLKSTEWGFDGALYDNLKAKTYPEIVFSLTSCTATADSAATGTYSLTAEGTLKIAGKEKPVVLTATVVVVNDNFKITGSKDLLMSDFGIPPPVMFFGAVKTDDKITIKWDVSMAIK